MIVIFCLDNHNGIMFNHRRQSKDTKVIEDIIKLCDGQKLYMSEYSKIMFQQDENIVKDIASDPDFLQRAQPGSYCFIEDLNINPYMDKMEKLILYKWNRHYPADLFFDVTILKNWTLKEIADFKGTSHEKITREVYCK